LMAADSTSAKDNSDYLNAERKWLLEKEIPWVFDQLMKLLRCSLASLAPKGTFKPESDSEQKYVETSQRMNSFEASNSSLKGFMTIDGWIIKEADIGLRFSKRPLFSTRIVELHPWTLEQVQNSHNLLKLGSALLLSFPRPLPVFSATELIEKLDLFCSYLVQARDHLSLPWSNRFPKKISSMSFIPNPPTDIVIEIGVKNQQIVLTAFDLQLRQRKNSGSSFLPRGSSVGGGGGALARAVSPTSTGGLSLALESSTLSSTLNPSSSGSLIGTAYTASETGQNIEVVDQAEILCEAPNLKFVFQAIEEAHCLSNDLRNKILTLR